MWWLIGLSAAGGIAVLVLLGRRNERAVRRDWELLLTPKGESLYRTIEGQVHTEMALADITYDEAFAVKELGSVDEAIRLLDVGSQVIERFAPSLLRLLATMAAFSRMVSAMAPVRPLRPRDFRLAQLASLAYLNRVLHQLLVSGAERFRLKLYIVGRCVGMATRFLLRSTRRIAEREPDAEREWDQIQAIRHDFQALTEESLESLRTLLVSLAAERREDTLRRLESHSN
jgi:hypothetical protein